MNQTAPSPELQFRLRRANRSDDRAILRLIDAAYGRPQPAALWRWWNYACPTGHSRTYVAEEIRTSKIVSSYNLHPIRVWYNGQRFNASLCTQVCTHPRYQGRGLFSLTARYALNQEQVFNSPVSVTVPNQLALPGHLYVGWEKAADLTFLEKRRLGPVAFQASRVLAFDERVDSLILRLEGQFTFLVEKDHRFLNWRYAKPGSQYLFFQHENQGRVDGYMVLKYYEEDGERRTHLLDIMADSEGVFRDLIACAESSSMGRDVLNVWSVTGNPWEPLLRTMGFEEAGSPRVFLTRRNFGNLERLPEGPWWFCLGDNDVY